MTQTRPRRGRPPRVTHDQIAEAVIAVGFPELTFAAVRERLEVSETTLYRYAPDRDALVRLGLDHAIARAAWPSLDGPWREVLTAYAMAAWHLFESYPGSATEVARGIVPTGVMRRMDDVCSALVDKGFTPSDAVLGCDLVFDLVADNRRGVEHYDAIVPDSGIGREQLHRAWEQDSAAVAGGRTEDRSAIHREIHASIVTDPIEWFSRKLTVVLDGVERALAPRA